MMPHLAVGRADLLDALRPVAGVLRRRQRGSLDAVLTFNGVVGLLRIAIGGTEVELPAVGRWDGSVRVPAAFVVGLGSARVLPADDSVVFRVEGGRLRVGALSAPATWEGADGEPLVLPLDAPWWTVLRLALEHPADAIVRAGLARTLAKAAKRRDNMIARAARVLEPLGVTPQDLRELIDLVLVREHNASGRP